MAGQNWDFAALDDEYNRLNGGPWAGLNGFTNVEDLGDNWSSDTWNEPFSDRTSAQNSSQRPADHSSHAPPLFSSPPQHVRNDTRGEASDHPTREHPPTPGRRPSRDLPIPHPYQPARFVPPAPVNYIPGTIPGSHDAYHQAIESATDDDDDTTMPPRRRQAADNSPVDLTQLPTIAIASTSNQPRTRKRSSTSNGGDANSANKRTKRASTSTVRVDLNDLEDEAPSAEAELLQTQQQDALKMQETNKDEGNVKIGQRNCIICLENYTNATTAICGHIFCHECLTRALMASEKNNDRGKGNCPACRKAINRRNVKEVIPISFLKKSAFKTKGRQAHNR